MKKALKKSLSILLAITLIFGSASVGLGEVDFAGLFAVRTKAATSGTTGDCTWTLDGTVLTISGSGNMGDYYDITLPWGTSVTKVVIKDGVTNIGDWAFYHCTSLTSVTIPDSVTSIGGDAFYNCTSLTSVTIPDSVTSIGGYAFDYCASLTSVAIPDSVTSIGDGAFRYCTSLTSIIVDTDNNNFSSVDGVLFNKNKTMLIQYPCGKTGTEYTIPDGVTSIGDLAFSYCTSLTSVTIPDSVTSIGNYAFCYCTSLTSVTIPDSVTSIGSGSFSWCTSLTSVTIPDSVTSIGSSSFSWCTSLTSVTIPDSVTSIGNYAFYNCTSLEYVFYSGTEDDRNNISISSYNGDLENATWLYEATGHTESDWIIDTEATCTEPGSKHKECTICGETLETEVIEATGHTASGWITDKKATVNAAGKKHKECTVCGEILETATIPQLKCKAVKLNKVANVTTGVRVYWTKTAGADKYRVYRKLKGGSWKVIGYSTKGYFTDKTAKSGKVYYYSVRAMNEAGLGAKCTTQKSIRCLADPTLKVPTSTRSGISLKWTKTTGASGYVVYRKVGNGSWKKLKTEKGVSNLSYVDKSARKGKKYTYKVRAYYGSTYSAYSNTKTITDKY